MTKPLESIRVTCEYGRTGHAWRCGHHTGIDLAASRGTETFAAQNARVIFAGRHGGWGAAYGIHVVLELADKTRLAYCHLDALDLKSLKDKRVKAGDRIGWTGATGNCFGPHLHLEQREAPFRYGQDDIDPTNTLNLDEPAKPSKPAPVKKAAAPKAAK